MSPRRGLDAACAEDGAGTLWYVGNDKHLWQVRDGQFVAVPESAGLAGQNINCLTIDSQGRPWIGTDNGFMVWDGNRFQDATPTNTEPVPAVTCLAVAPDQHIWAVAGGSICEAVDRRWNLKPAAPLNFFSGNPGHVGL